MKRPGAEKAQLNPAKIMNMSGVSALGSPSIIGNMKKFIMAMNPSQMQTTTAGIAPTSRRGSPDGWHSRGLIRPKKSGTTTASVSWSALSSWASGLGIAPSIISPRMSAMVLAPLRFPRLRSSRLHPSALCLGPGSRAVLRRRRSSFSPS